MRLLVALPALNEAATIRSVIEGIPEHIPGVDQVSVLVVDDGSSDATRVEAEAAGALVISHDQRRGVGAAFQTALRHAIASRADVLVTLDADGQFNPADIPKLIEAVIAGRADFATASRFKDPQLVPVMPPIKIWGNRQMSRLISRLTRRRFYDVSCGMRCYSRDAMLNLNLLGQFTYTQEVFLNLAFKGMRIVEVPIKVRGERQFGKSRVASNVWSYAWRSSRIIFRAYRDYRPMAFFGSLALTLFVPAFLLGLFLAIHYAINGSFTPHKWAGFISGGLAILGAITLVMGLAGDMLNRHRLYLEELLYQIRKRQTTEDDPATETTEPQEMGELT
ncbi:MAG: glycosyltransferase family 2 protein [Planctomycetota bacterium]